MALYPFHKRSQTFYPIVILVISVSCLSHYIIRESKLESAGEYRTKNFDPDALRAISKTKTKSCGLQMAHFVDEQVKLPFHALDIKGTCPSTNENIFREVGCLDSLNETLFDIADFGPPLDNTSNRETCLQFCFSRGYFFAGHRQTDMSCRCTNQVDAKKLSNRNRSLSCKHSEGTSLYLVAPARSHPIQPVKLEHLNGGEARIRIAFLLSLNGRSIMQIRRLLKMIYAEQHLYYIHVDVRRQYLFKKLLPLESSRSNVILAKHRLDTIWGGSTLLSMILNTISDLSNHQWDYLINLSESDLPLKSVRELEHYLSLHPRSTIYLRAHNMTGDRFIRKQGLDQWFYQCENRMWRLGKRQLHTNIRYSGGSDWFALPRAFCEAILRGADSSEYLVRPLLRLFNYTLLPVESFFHTVALNTEFCESLVDNNLRVTNWKRDRHCGCQHKHVVDWCGCSPKTYRWSDLKRLKRTKSSSSIFFSRKFDPTVSSSIIAVVDRHLVNNQDLDSLDLDTRYWLNVWEVDDDQLEARKLNPYHQFGMFALNQIMAYRKGLLLQSIDLFFNEDRFVGVILKYCEALDSCREILVSRNTSAHLHHYNTDCFIGEKNRRQLKVIEVNEGFDTGERIFRNYMPLTANSALVVYHEWLVNHTRDKDVTYRDKMRFMWVGPLGGSKSNQDVKLTAKIDQPRLLLAHKMNAALPLDSGLWHLRVYDELIKCLDYQFLIFNETSFDLKHIEQGLFNQFYQVTRACSSTSTPNFQPCNVNDWSSHAMDAKLATYDLS